MNEDAAVRDQILIKLTLDEALKAGIQAHQAGRLQEANIYYDAVLKKQRNHPDANHNMGLIAEYKGKLEDAIELYKIALVQNPEFEQFWISYLNALFRAGIIHEAKVALKEADLFNFNSQRFNTISRGIKRAEQSSTIEQTRPHTDSQKEPYKHRTMLPSQKQINQLNDYFVNRNFETGLNKALQLLAEFPGSFVLHNICGVFLDKLGNFNAAIASYEKAIARNSNYADAHFNMGNTLRHKTEFLKAIQSYKKAIKIRPNYFEAFNNMGLAFKESKKLKSAIDCYRKALKINGTSVECLNNLGIAFAEVNQIDKAISCYTKALEIQPNFVSALNNLGLALLEKGQIATAIEQFQRAIKIEPKYADAIFNLANSYKEIGEISAAVSSYKTALAIDPKRREFIESYFDLVIQLKTSNPNLLLQFKNNYPNFEKKFLLNPKFQALKSIDHFLDGKYHLATECAQKYHISRTDENFQRDQQNVRFGDAYVNFVEHLSSTDLERGADKSESFLYHFGESHCLSFAHKHLHISGVKYRIKPCLIFGAKTFHFSRKDNNLWKSITTENYLSIPKTSKILISFGEIDCRLTEGFIVASKKTNVSTERLITQTVEGYVDWHSNVQRSLNHKLFFVNVPAPIFDTRFCIDDNSKRAKVVYDFNKALAHMTHKKGHAIVDVYKLTSDHNGFSNTKYHIDQYHLGPHILHLIEKQLNLCY